jgi:hypothetical protein
MNTFILLILLLLTSVNSFGDITQIESSSKVPRKETDKKSSDELIDNIERIEIAKDFKNLMEKQGIDIPVVDHELIKLNQGLVHIRKCISEESEGTVGIYDGKFNVEVRIYPTGLVKNLEIHNAEKMQIYLKACFISGISRVVFAQPLDGMETVLTREFNLKLYPEDPIKEKQLALSFQ